MKKTAFRPMYYCLGIRHHLPRCPVNQPFGSLEAMIQETRRIHKSDKLVKADPSQAVSVVTRFIALPNGR